MKMAIMYVIATGKPILIKKYEEGWSGKGYWIDISDRKWEENELTL